jgi:O-antigen/teichoic acid export membrane protein
LSEDLIQIAEASARGSFFLVTGRIAALVIQAVAVFVVARLLGPDLYGIYSLSLVFPTLLLIVVDLGVDQAIIRFSAKLRVKGRNQDIARLVRHGLLFKLVIGVAMFAVCFMFSDYLAVYVLDRPDISVYIRLASASIIFQVISATSSSAFVGLDRMEYGALVIDVQALAKAVASILFVILGLSVIGALVGHVLSFLAAGVLGGALLYFKMYRHLNSDRDDNVQVEDSWKDSLKILLSYGSPLYISALLLGVIPQLQSIILSVFTSDYDIGNFKASLNFISLLSGLAIPIGTSLFPAFSKFDKNSEKVKTFFSLSTKFGSLLLVPSALLMIVLSKEIVQIIYGASFASASVYLSLHATLFLLIGLGYQVQKSLFNGLGETKETLKISLIQFVFFLFLAPYLTGSLGVTGLITSILMSTTFATAYGAYRAKSKCKVKFDHKSLIGVYLLALVSVIPTFLCKMILPFPVIFKVIMASAVYLISYLTLLPLTHTITKSELKNMESVVQKIGPLKPIAKLIFKYEYAFMRS